MPVKKTTTKKPVAKKPVAKKPAVKKATTDKKQIAKKLDELGADKFLGQFLTDKSAHLEEATTSLASITATVDSNNDWVKDKLMGAASSGEDITVGDIMGNIHKLEVNGGNVSLITKSHCPVSIEELLETLPTKKSKKSKKGKKSKK